MFARPWRLLTQGRLQTANSTPLFVIGSCLHAGCAAQQGGGAVFVRYKGVFQCRAVAVADAFGLVLAVQAVIRGEVALARALYSVKVSYGCAGETCRGKPRVFHANAILSPHF